MTITEKIAALINKANSTDSQQEADALMSKAQQLMRENNLSHSDIENTGNEIEREYYEQRGWKLELFRCLANNNNCTTLKGGKGRSIVGEKKSIEVVKFMFDFYCNCLVSLSERYAVANPNTYSTKLKTKNSYCMGAVAGLSERLRKETAKHIEAEPQLQGIIHVKKDAVNQWINKEIGKVGKASGRAYSCGDTSAYYQGKADAQTIRSNNKMLA